jgi:hypothetical protein
LGGHGDADVMDGRGTPPGLMYVVSIPPPMRSSLSAAGLHSVGGTEDAFGSPTGYRGGADALPPATSSSDQSDDTRTVVEHRHDGRGRGAASRGPSSRSSFSSVLSRSQSAPTQDAQLQAPSLLNAWARLSHSGVLPSPTESSLRGSGHLAAPPPSNRPMGNVRNPQHHHHDHHHDHQLPILPGLPVFMSPNTEVVPARRYRQRATEHDSSGFTTKSTTASSSSTKDSDEYLALEISSQRLLHANHPQSSSGGAAVSEGSMSLSVRSTAHVELEPLTAGSVSPRDQLAALRNRSYQRSVPGFHARGGGLGSSGSSAAPKMFVVPGTRHDEPQMPAGPTWDPPSPRRRSSRRSSSSAGKNPLPLTAREHKELGTSPLPQGDGGRRSAGGDC